jgi:hypothetical protein
VKLNFEIQQIPKQAAVAFVSEHHYSPIMPVLTRYFLGGFIDGKLQAVLTLGWGTQPKATIKKMFPNLDNQDYYEIGKMCLLDELPRNSETQFLSSVIRWMKLNVPKVSFLYTLADGIMGKPGYVYQAASFLYGGYFKTSVYRSSTGEKIHPRTSKKLCEENARFLKKPPGEKVFWLTHDFMETKGIEKYNGLMYRYIFPLNRRGKRIIKNESTVEWSKNYPKDKDLKFWKMMGKGLYEETDMPIFNYDIIVQNKKNGPHIKTNRNSTLERFFEGNE